MSEWYSLFLNRYPNLRTHHQHHPYEPSIKPMSPPPSTTSQVLWQHARHCTTNPPIPLHYTTGSMTTGKTLHGAIGATAPGCDGRGVGKALRIRAVEVARERGYNSYVVLSTPLHSDRPISRLFSPRRHNFTNTTATHHDTHTHEGGAVPPRHAPHLDQVITNIAL